MKKTVYVKAECGFHANREIEELLRILDEYTGIKAKVHGTRFEVETEKVIVRFVVNSNKAMDGMRCDIPVRFGRMSGMMTKGREYPELHSMKDIAKYIVDMEG